MKLTKQNLKQIRQFARDKIGGFGMWLELGEKVGYTGEVIPPANWSNVKSDYFYNMLTPCDSMDLHDFISWSYLPTLEIQPIDGFCLIDFYVHDHEELKDNVQVLIKEDNTIVKMWVTWHDEDELAVLIGKEISYHP